MSEPDPYLLGYREAEQNRLERQADELARDSEWLFDQIGVCAGWRVVEIGCGPRGCLGLLSKRVGSTGRVVGVERSAGQVERARHFVAEGRLTNVEVLDADARSLGLPDRTFDLATARLVLANVPRPEELVAEMVASRSAWRLHRSTRAGSDDVADAILRSTPRLVSCRS